MEMNQYINKIKQIPMLTKAEEKELIQNYVQNRDKYSENKILESFLKLSLSIALKYAKFNTKNNAMDIISEANLGLIHGLKKFNLEKGENLATYLIFWIRAYIQNYLFSNSSIVNKNTTTAQKKLFFTWKKIYNRLCNSSENHEINSKELQIISNETNISISDIQLFIKSKNHDCTLNEELSTSDHLPTEDENQDTIQRKKILIQAIQSLKQKDKDIFLARYAITFDNSSTKQKIYIDKKNIITDIAKQYKLSSERIRQIIEKAVDHIKNYIKQYYFGSISMLTSI